MHINKYHDFPFDTRLNVHFNFSACSALPVSHSVAARQVIDSNFRFSQPPAPSLPVTIHVFVGSFGKQQAIYLLRFAVFRVAC